MSIADLFEGGERKRQKGHFRNLVLLAHADDIVTDEESAFLIKMGTKMGLSEEQIEEIKSDPKKYPINPPISREDRVRRLVELIEMANIDGVIDDSERALIERFAAAISFQDSQVAPIIDATIKGMSEKLDISEIVDGILGE